MNKESIKWEI